MLELKKYIMDNCVKRGEYTLSSGVKSDTYVDVKKALTHPRYLYMISDLMMSSIDKDVNVVAGVEFGALPIVFSCATLSGCFQYNSLFAVSVRKDEKTYGDKKRIVGLDNIEKGSKVCIVEDVVTTGGTVLRCAKLLEARGYEIVQIMSVIDRRMDPVRRDQIGKYKFISLFNLEDIKI